MLSLVGTFVGGVGLFLLGMELMTDGLKRAQGTVMRRILVAWTHSPMRALLAGTMVTGLVQASGAVIVATLGFVNAGLLPLLGAMWVIFGANIGTTMTGWLVALVGFDIDLKAIALPFIGLGMATSMIAGRSRIGGLGRAVAGFGLFFVGISVLQGGFADLARAADLNQFASAGVWGTLLFVAVGFGLTVMMQSSSAALAIAITATAGGLLPFTAAAATAIGANVGTTSTAALAVIGASANAKRLAAAHVVFNLITGGVALLAMPWLLDTSLALSDGNLATGLAWFHTQFNILGVLIMWPLARPLSTWLNTRFTTPISDEARPQFLHDAQLESPRSAMHAVARELVRLGELTRRINMAVVSAEAVPNGSMTRDRTALSMLSAAIGEHITKLQARDLDKETAQALPLALQVVQYYATSADLSLEFAEHLAEMHDIEDPESLEFVARFKHSGLKLIDESVDASAPDDQRTNLDHHYAQLKQALLTRALSPELSTDQMVVLLEQMSLLRRALRQLIKGHCELFKLGHSMGSRAHLRQTLTLPALPH
jgi:phosphate:Na+ symporter